MSKNQFFRKKDQEKDQEKQKWQNAVQAFLGDMTEVEKKHMITLVPIISPEGPRLLPRPLQIKKDESEKSYVKPNEGSLDSKIQDL